IAQVEPRLAAEFAQSVHELPRLSAAAPARFGVRLPGERVDERIDVRRHVQAEVLEIVAGVDDERDLVGRQELRETQCKLRAADPGGDRDEASLGHAQRNMSSSSGRMMSRAVCAWSSCGKPRTSATGMRSVVSPITSVAAVAMESARLIIVTFISRP